MIPWMLWSVAFAAGVGVAAHAAQGIAGFFGAPRRYIWMSAIVACALLPALLATQRRSALTERPTGAEASIQRGLLGPGGDAIQRVAAASSAATRSSDPVVGDLPFSAGRAPGASAVDWLGDWMHGASVIVRRGVTRILMSVTASSRRADDWAAALWLLASMTLMIVFARAVGALRRRSAAWHEAQLGPCRALVADAGPAVIGFARPRIVVPAWVLSLERSTRELMLRHEMEHIRAGDPRMVLIGGVALIVFPWNAALWWIVRQLRVAIELDCDARVIRAVGGPREYGRVLLTVGERHTATFPFAASLAEPRSQLERRIKAMITPRPRHPMLASLPSAAIAMMAMTAVSRAPRPVPLRPTAGAVVTSVAVPEAVSSNTASVAPRADRVARAPVTAPSAAPAQVPGTAMSIQPEREATGPLATLATPTQAMPPVNAPQAGVPDLSAGRAKTLELDCDSIRSLIADNVPAIALGAARPEFVVLVLDANDRIIRALPGMGTVAIQAANTAGLTRAGLHQRARTCESGYQGVVGQSGASGRGAGVPGASADTKAATASTPAGVSEPGAPAPSPGSSADQMIMATLFPPKGAGVLRGRVAGLAVVRAAAPPDSVLLGSLFDRPPSGCGQATCEAVGPCCAPWKIETLPDDPRVSGIRRFFIDEEPSSLVLGVESIARNPQLPSGRFTLSPPNQASGLTSPGGGSSGIDGILPRQITAVQEATLLEQPPYGRRPIAVIVVTTTALPPGR